MQIQMKIHTGDKHRQRVEMCDRALSMTQVLEKGVGWQGRKESRGYGDGLLKIIICAIMQSQG